MPNKKAEPDIVLNDGLPTLFIDGFSIQRRKDGMNIVRLLASLPEGPQEEARFIAQDARLKVFVNLLCENLNYYPSKRNSKNKDSKQES